MVLNRNSAISIPKKGNLLLRICCAFFVYVQELKDVGEGSARGGRKEREEGRGGRVEKGGITEVQTTTCVSWV